MTKMKQFLNLLSDMDNEAGVARLNMLIADGAELRRKATETGVAFDAQHEDIGYQQREKLASQLAAIWLDIRHNEARKTAKMIAFYVPLTGPRAIYLEPGDRDLTEQPVARDTMFKAIRPRRIWEALDVTMKRRAAEEYRELAMHKSFKVLGVAVYQGELMFVYSFWNEEHTQLCLYRLPVQEEDLPDLAPAKAE